MSVYRGYHRSQEVGCLHAPRYIVFTLLSGTTHSRRSIVCSCQGGQTMVQVVFAKFNYDSMYVTRKDSGNCSDR
jgi:hypothetical protein